MPQRKGRVPCANSHRKRRLKLAIDTYVGMFALVGTNWGSTCVAGRLSRGDLGWRPRPVLCLIASENRGRDRRLCAGWFPGGLLAFVVVVVVVEVCGEGK